MVPQEGEKGPFSTISIQIGPFHHIPVQSESDEVSHPSIQTKKKKQKNKKNAKTPKRHVSLQLIRTKSLSFDRKSFSHPQIT
jgi:hypothetical protein